MSCRWKQIPDSIPTQINRVADHGNQSNSNTTSQIPIPIPLKNNQKKVKYQYDTGKSTALEGPRVGRVLHRPRVSYNWGLSFLSTSGKAWSARTTDVTAAFDGLANKAPRPPTSAPARSVARSAASAPPSPGELHLVHTTGVGTLLRSPLYRWTPSGTCTHGS